MRVYKLLFSSVLFLLFSFPSLAFAAGSFFISPPSGTYKVGELFSVLLNVNTGGVAINAGSGQLNFDNSRLELIDLGFSHSIFTLWTSEPTFSNAAGTVNFSGGLPSPGFTGASGSIVRLTFKAKATGQAPLTFISGAILANDGAGTNIADSFKGALYSVIGGASPTPIVTPAKPANVIQESAVEIIEPPRITDWPKELQSGDSITISGLGLPLSKIIIAVQKGSDEPSREETFSGPDGRFKFTPSKPLKAGFYRIWARNVSLSGVASAPSETVTIDVTEPTFIRIGTVAINYLSIIMTLLALILLLFVSAVWIWWKVRKWQRRQGKEIAEAEQEVHHVFDTLRDGLARYLSYLAGAKDTDAMKRREARSRKELREELDNLEQNIEKEVRDIKKRK